MINLLIYLLVGLAEWWLALRRTLACARGERIILITITFIENLLGLWVLSNFIKQNDWMIALSYSTGAALGAFLVSFRMEKNVKKDLDLIQNLMYIKRRTINKGKIERRIEK